MASTFPSTDFFFISPYAQPEVFVHQERPLHVLLEQCVPAMAFQTFPFALQDFIRIESGSHTVNYALLVKFVHHLV
jgi:hypothetical protein